MTSPQKGLKPTYSFKEFTKEYIEPSASSHYKPTKLYRKLVDDGELGDTVKDDLFKYTPNIATYGNTWDAKHLDRFLSTSPWGQSASTLRTQASFGQYTMSMPPVNGTSSLRNSGIASPGALLSMKSNKTGATHPKESHFFRNGERFSPEKSSIHDFTYKVYENNLNQFVTNLPVQDKVLEGHYNKLLTRSPPPFETKSLEFSIKPEESIMPHARREQLELTKKQQREFQEWKEANKLVTKRNRVYHAGFKSGILSLDNPLYDGTRIYRDEHDELKYRNEEKRRIEARHQKDVEMLSRTNPQIEFMNKDAALIDNNPEYKQYYMNKPIVPGNGKVRVQLPHTKVLFDSQDRLFGAEVKKYSLNRADYLRSQELRGKHYDILSNVVNDIELKHDKGESSGSRFQHPLGKSMLVRREL